MAKQNDRITRLSNGTKHFFHVVSNVRPIVWIGLYVAITPIFALIYWALPDTQFRIPDGSATDYGSWLYYSIVTITTLGFGDYTPAHGWAQAVTAVEVMCGLVLLGFFLNAVGAMKSEIDVESEIEKQKAAHFSLEKEKLMKTIPSLMHLLNTFLAYCYAVTTPAKRRDESPKYNPDFQFSDMQDFDKPSGLPFDASNKAAVTRLLSISSQTSLALDSLQNRIDITLWPELLDDSFRFVANTQMFTSEEELNDHAHKLNPTDKESPKGLSSKIAGYSGIPDRHEEGDLHPLAELYYYIKENAQAAINLESALTRIANDNNQ